MENKYNRETQNFYYLHMGYDSDALSKENPFVGIALKIEDKDDNNYDIIYEYNNSANKLSSNFFIHGLKHNDILLVHVKNKNKETYNICKITEDSIETDGVYKYVRKVKLILENISCPELVNKIKEYQINKLHSILVGINHLKNYLLDIIYAHKEFASENTILYGIPGCGKSYKVKNDYLKKVDNSNVERLVFHPDYTYSDFIGQIMPRLEGDTLTYKFVPGPFTKILKKAIMDESEVFYLVIEEINRGNAPAILGDIFQLLDRNYLGSSEYLISNPDIARYIYDNEDQKIFIPRNLSIIATMNTCDQNVFTLDTAFQRRWRMEFIQNIKENCDFRDKIIANTKITWATFVDTINEKICNINNFQDSTSDKRLGYFFIKSEELSDAKIFCEKVIKYLYDDVFKYKRDNLFKKDYYSFEQIVKQFTTSDNPLDIFNNLF